MILYKTNRFCEWNFLTVPGLIGRFAYEIQGMLLALLLRINRGTRRLAPSSASPIRGRNLTRAVPSTSNHELPQEVRCILRKTA